MLVLLSVLVFVHNAGLGFYSAHELEPLPAFEFLHNAAFLCGVVWWLRAEVRRSAVVPVYCSGLLVSLGWLVMIPYHLFKTRGVAGLIPLSILIAAVIVPYVLGYVLFAL